MKLSKIRIQNFKSYQDEVVRFSDFTTLIGRNNSGKSTVLRAIRLAIDQESPSPEEWNERSIPNVIFELTFDEITDAERLKPGIAGLVFDGKIRLKYIASIDESEKVSRTYQAYSVEEIIQGFAQSLSQCSDEIRAIAQELGLDAQRWRTAANRERAKERIRELHGNLISRGAPGWSDDSISIDQALKQGLPSIIYVPALRDPQEETKKTQRRSMFMEVINKRVIPSLTDEQEYLDVSSGLEDFKSRFNDAGYAQVDEVNNSINAVVQDFISLQIKLSLGDFDLEDLIARSATVKFDDGVSTTVENQGHGAQRAYLYGLTRMSGVYAAAEDRSFILLYEEPELFVHPHMLRTLRNSLRSLSSQAGWQTICTTHSPFLVDVAESPLSMVVIRKRQSGNAQVCQLDSDPFEVDPDGERSRLRAMLDFHPSVSEAFFSEKVVLVEGDSEIAVISQLVRLPSFGGVNLSHLKNYTFVSCGGKWTIMPIARLMLLFGAEVKVIHDRDRKGRTQEELDELPGFHPYNANLKIASLVGDGNAFVSNDTFENIIFDDADDFDSKDKPYRAWKRFKEIIEAGSPSEQVLNLVRFLAH